MSILGGYFKTFLVFLCISIETQHRDKIPQLGLITVYCRSSLIMSSMSLLDLKNPLLIL